MESLLGKLVNKVSDTVVGEKKSFEELGEFSPENIMNIHVSTGSTPIEVVPTDKDEIVVRYHGEGNEKGLERTQLFKKVVNDTLHVKVEQSGHFGMGVIYLSDQLSIELPSKFYHEFIVECSSGNAELHDIKANILKGSTNSGKIDASNIIVKQVVLKASSGKVSAKNIKSDEAVFQASSGKLSIDTIKSTTVELKASSGKILAEHIFASLIFLKASSGKIEASDMIGIIDAESSSGKTCLHLEELQQHINIKTSSGSVDLTVEKEPISMELNFKSSSGSASIDFPMEYKENKHNRINGLIGDGDCKVNVRTSSGSFQLFKNKKTT